MEASHPAISLVARVLLRGRLVLASTPADWAIAEPTIGGGAPFTLHVNGGVRTAGSALEVASVLVATLGAAAAYDAALSAFDGVMMPPESTASANDRATPRRAALRA